MGAAWRRIATCGGRSVPPRANKGWTGRRATWHPVLAVGPAAGPRLWAGDAHLSVLPPRHAPDHCRHHPGVGDHAHPAASPAGVRPTADCPGPYAPRDMHVRLNPRPVVWSRQRRGRSSAVSRPVAPLYSLCHPPPSLPQPAVPRPAPEGTPVGFSLPHPERHVLAARCCIAGRFSGLPRRAGGACSGRRTRWSPASTRGVRPGGQRENAVYSTYPSPILP